MTDSEKYHLDLNGTWAVVDYDGKPLPGRWATEELAAEFGYAGKYLLTGYGVEEVGRVSRDA